MKLQQPNHDLSHNLSAPTKTFGIKWSREAFLVLSKSLYANPHGAIIRELYSNMVDSHTRAGVKRSPEIHFPSDFNPDLRFKDYGTGMAPEQIETLYSTYFDSDKRDTNNEIGGHGLGSKTPFAVTDSFTVSTRWHGTKHVYAVFVNESGMPDISKLGAFPTDEPNGMEVAMALPKSDLDTLRGELRKQLDFFDMRPVVSGALPPEPVSYIFRNEYIGFIKSDYRRSSDPCVVMGGVAYYFSWQDLPAEIYNKHDIIYTRNNFAIFANIGDLDTQASREKLSFDGESLLKLDKLLSRATAYVRQAGVNYVLQGETPLQCDHRLRDCLRLFGFAPYKSVSDSFQSTAAIGWLRFERKKPRVSWLNYLSTSLPAFRDDVNILWVDEAKLPYIQIIDHNDHLFQNNTVVIRGGKDAVLKAMDKIYPKTVFKLSELDRPARDPQVYSRRSRSPRKLVTKTVYVQPMNTIQFSADAWDEVKLDDMDVDWSHFAWIKTRGKYIYDKEDSKLLEALNDISLPPHLRLIGVPRNEKALDKRMPCRSLKEFAQDFMGDWLRQHDLQSAETSEAALRHVPYMAKRVLDCEYGISRDWHTSMPDTFIGQYSLLVNIAQKASSERIHVEKIADLLGFEIIKPRFTDVRLVTMAPELRKRYPLLFDMAEYRLIIAYPVAFKRYIYDQEAQYE